MQLWPLDFLMKRDPQYFLLKNSTSCYSLLQQLTCTGTRLVRLVETMLVSCFTLILLFVCVSSAQQSAKESMRVVLGLTKLLSSEQLFDLKSTYQSHVKQQIEEFVAAVLVRVEVLEIYPFNKKRRGRCDRDRHLASRMHAKIIL